MPVNTYHIDYEMHREDWRTCRDAYRGQRAVKKAHHRYLPRLSGQTDEEYEAYKTRALFYSITSKSVSALVGMAIARPPILKYPEQMSSYFVDNSGTQFFEALGTTIAEILLMGRYGILIDRSEDNAEPQIHGYKTEAIINWKTDRNGKPYLVVLAENAFDAEASDEYNAVVRQQYRVLRLAPKGSILSNAEFQVGLLTDFSSLPIVNEIGSDVVYTVSIFGNDGEMIKTKVPSNTGRPMNIIPFYVGNPFGIGFGINKSPMLDIADINMSHYRTSADLEHGRHFTGLPTAVVSGVAAGTVLKIGSTTAWVLPDVNAKAQYLEFTGQGLKSLENALAEKQAQMATLSSRLMDNSANGSEAADAIRLRYMSESASLSSIVRTAEALLNLAYKTIAAMTDLSPDDVDVHLEKEFHNVRMSPTELAKLTESYLTGGMSVETYVFNLRRGELLDTQRTDTEEIQSLETIRKAAEAAAAQAAKPSPNNP